jgi:NPCBM/NEW2 domain
MPVVEQQIRKHRQARGVVSASAVLLLCCSAALSSDRVVLLDGRAIEATVKGIGAGGQVRFEEPVPPAMPIQDLRRIVRSDVRGAGLIGPGDSLRPRAVIDKVVGDVRVRPTPASPWQPAREGMVLGEDASVQNAFGATVELHIGLERTLRLDGTGTTSVREAVRDLYNQKTLVILRGGGGLWAQSATIAADGCQVRGLAGGDLKLPLEAMSALRFVVDEPATSGGGQRNAFDTALAEPDAAHDRLFVLHDGRLQSVAGALESLDDQQAVFVWQGKSRPVPRSRLFGIVLAQTGEPFDATGLCRAVLADGTSAWGQLVGLQDDRLTLRLHGQTTLEMPWSAVARLDVRSRRVVFLSDQDPLESQERAIVTLTMPWRRDHSVSGGPIRIGDRSFESGLGVHARSRLVFAPGGRFDTFAATIGIDAETEGKGDCVFVVQGDDKELLRTRVRGADPPRDVHLDIAGVQRLTLLVEPGEGLDLADHADWADARFIRKADDEKQ